MYIKMTYIFSIEGNIGSGKSTLVENLKEKLPLLNGTQIIYVSEPVSEWNTIKDKEGKTILEKFYANQEKYSFSFQMMAYISRLSLLRKIVKKNPYSIIISERSVFTDKEVFAKMLYDDDKIEEVNYKIYLQWFNEFIEDLPITGLLYVKTTPEKCKTRVDFRARTGEQIPIEYLKKCHIYHEQWINNEFKTKTIEFNGNHDFKDNFPNEWLEQIKDFINSYVSTKNSNSDSNIDAYINNKACWYGC